MKSKSKSFVPRPGRPCGPRGEEGSRVGGRRAPGMRGGGRGARLGGARHGAARLGAQEEVDDPTLRQQQAPEIGLQKSGRAGVRGPRRVQGAMDWGGYGRSQWLQSEA